MGLISNIDAFLDMSINEILDEIKVTQEIKNALTKQEGVLGKILQLILCYEKAEWVEINSLCDQLHVESNQLIKYYFEAIAETDDIINKIS